MSLPKGGGAIRAISEKFTFNAATGTASVSVPLPLSQGRGSFTPQLRLSYDSGGGNGPFGMGWSLDLPAITRRTDKGLPRYLDTEESDIFVLAGAEDLVPILDGGGAPVSAPRTLYGVDYDVFRYRPRVDSLFARVERWTARRSGVSHWRTITNDDVTTWYGFDDGSTIVSADDARHVFSYLICRRYDSHGNLALYTYAEEDDDGLDLTAAHEANRPPADRTRQRYLKSLRYGNVVPFFPTLAPGGPEPALPSDFHFELVLDYGEHPHDTPVPGDTGTRAVRPDPFSTYRAGYEVRTYRRCLRALMFHHFEHEPGVGKDCLVRSLELRYSDQLDVPDPDAPVYSLLASAREAGHRRDGHGSKAMPPLEFDYSKPIVDPAMHTLELPSAENLPQGVDGAHYRFVDLDSEGMPGIVADDGVAWRFKRNLSPLTGVPRADGTEPLVRAQFGALEKVEELPSGHDLRGGGVQLLDISGEGRLAAVSFRRGEAGFSTRVPHDGWAPFTTFRSLPTIDMREPHLRFIDLTGDGRADVLLGESNLWTVYPSLGEEGFAEAENVRAPWDEESGIRPIFTNEVESVQLADMTGDGLADLVRVRNGDICFWPNLGYGRFGRKVTMSNAPHFATRDQFDPQRLRLTDIDGSATTDVLYIGHDGVHVCFNRSGNSWADPQLLAVFPSADRLSGVQTADLLGNGTACLVWSSPLPGHARASLRYVDLMSGSKPHLLVRTRNNLGAETRLHYAPSTRFYLEDLYAGRPWVTRLPFPVHVLERVEVYDWIGRSRSVSRYAYHHGHYDGVEREFRGFGMVEEWDTESHRADTSFPDAENWDTASWSPPVYTKTWFHTGVFLEENVVSKHFETEYWSEPVLSAAKRRAMLLPDSVVRDAASLTPQETREARRALKARMLRRETYADDGSARAGLPYTVVEQNYEVRRVQKLGDNRYAVFAAHSREHLTFHYERTADDPRVTHSVTLEVDPYDNPLRTVDVSYPRRGNPDPEPLLSTTFRKMLAYDQRRLRVMGAAHAYATAIDTNDVHRTPQPSEAINAELTGLAPAAALPGITNLFTFEELDTGWASLWNTAHDLPYEELSSADVDGTGPPPSTPGRRIVEHLRTRYRSDDLTALLPLGTQGELGLPGTTYHLALTPGLLSRVLGGRAGPAELAEGGYVQLAGHPGWWIPNGLAYHSPNEGDTAAQELAFARAHFFRTFRTTDPFGGISHTDYDVYDLLPTRAADPVGNAHSATNDYRVLEAWQIVDPNDNVAEVAFDAIGHVVGSAVKGKTTETLGDSLTGFEPDLDDPTIAAHLADPLADPLGILGDASSRLVYDLDAYLRTRDDAQPQPVVVYTIDRETHVSDLAAGDETRCRHTFVYSDGNAHEIQRKVQAEPGPLVDMGPDIDPRWAASGWLIKDNKNRPVRQYEPFFTATHAFEFNVHAGVSRVTLYDPAGRVVAMLHPDDSWHKTVFDAWRVAEWDASDTVAISDPRLDPDVGDHFRRLLGSAPNAFTSWYDKRIGGTFGPTPADRDDERDAAVKAAAHAGTPHVDHLDSAGHTCLVVQDLGGGERHPMRYIRDAEGEQTGVVDALGRRVIEYMVREQHGPGFTYVASRDLAGRELYHNQMDAGERRMLPDVATHPIRSWDARGHAVRILYDRNQRPTHRYVATNGGSEKLVSRTVYGEGMPSRNLCGELWRHYDESGLTANDRLDFKGNIIDRSRQFAVEYRTETDWTPLAALTARAPLDAAAAPLLDSTLLFTAHSKYDAFNRPRQVVTPHTTGMKPNVILATYGTGGLVDQVDVWEQVATIPTDLLDPTTADIHAVTDIDYDPRGTELKVMYGNGTITERHFDPLRFRLQRIVTTRPSSFPANKRVVQDLHYAHDPSGNVTRIRDEADIHNVVFFSNRRVDPSSDFTYDAVYQLTRATGREHLGQNGGSPAQPGDSDAPRMNVVNPSDGNAMGTYIETYKYNAVGNILSMLHQVGPDAWRRRYAYGEPSLVESSRMSNRLSATSLPGDPTAGPYTARYHYDAHGNTVQMPRLPELTWSERDWLRSTTRQVVSSGRPRTTFYTYDGAENRMRKVTDAASPTDAPGIRRKEKLYVGSLEIFREYGPDGTTVTLERQTLLLTAAHKPVAVLETRTIGTDPAPKRVVKYQYGNHAASATLELDESAAVVSYEEYFPYGGTAYQAVRSTTETSKRLRYNRKERDDETGFYYFGARYYAPWLGRWVSTDPELLNDGPNPYLFVHANPVNLVDPTGTAGIIIFGVALTAEQVLTIAFGVTLFSMGTGATIQAQQRRRRQHQHPEPVRAARPVPGPGPGAGASCTGAGARSAAARGAAETDARAAARRPARPGPDARAGAGSGARARPHARARAGAAAARSGARSRPRSGARLGPGTASPLAHAHARAAR